VTSRNPVGLGLKSIISRFTPLTKLLRSTRVFVATEQNGSFPVL